MKVDFSLNGVRTEIHAPDPHLLLIDYLRSPQVGLNGTKLSCGEGGCGACAVILTRKNVDGQLVHEAINACLRPVCSLDGLAITTIEGLGDTKHGLSTIQAKIAEMNGSQCGFCTPGMVIAGTALFHSELNPHQIDLENAFDGHICRCTGYRPILQALRSLAPDYTGEENITNFSCSADSSVRLSELDRLPSRLSQTESEVHFAAGDSQWFRPLTLDRLLVLTAACRGSGSTMLVGGNTSRGIYPELRPVNLIDVSQIREMQVLERQHNGIRVGAACTLTQIQQFQRTIAMAIDPTAAAILSDFARHISEIANREVRNAGTIGGNFVMARGDYDRSVVFVSDIDTLLTMANAQVTVASSSFEERHRTYPVNSLPALEELPKDYVLTDFFIPFTQDREYVRSYKSRARRQNSHAIVNAAFKVVLSESASVKDFTVVFGGVARRSIRFNKTERAIVGLQWSEDTLSRLLKAACNEFNEALESTALLELYPKKYLESQVESLCYKFFCYVFSQIDDSQMDPRYRSAADLQFRPLSTAQQEVHIDLSDRPVGEPFINRNAVVQVCGEARYTQDIPLPPMGLHGVPVLSQKARSKFRFPCAEAELTQLTKKMFPSVEKVIVASHVPGKNVLGLGEDEELFASESVSYEGQLIAIVLSSDRVECERAAEWLEKEILYFDQRTPILNIQAALDLPNGQGLFSNTPSITYIPEIIRKGSDRKWFDEPDSTYPRTITVRGSQECQGQAQFYMETQSCIAIPEEEQSITLFASTQSPANDQAMAASALGITVANVQVEVRRIGGGFGGKQFRAGFNSAAASVAAWNVRRPVRIALSRKQDMRIVGKRHPMLGHYVLSVSRKGKFRGENIDLVADGGSTRDCSFPVINLAQQHADCCYNVPTFKTSGKVVRTNTASNTAMRSFGVVQATLVAESAVEHAAHALKVLPEDLRRINFYKSSKERAYSKTHFGEALKFCNLSEVWDSLIRSADFAGRLSQIEHFNRQNRWRKRGISTIPLKFGIGFQPRMMDQANALVNIYASDGSVLLQHAGVEMGQALNTKMMQIAAETLGIPPHYISVGDTWTGSTPNAVATAASISSDLNGGAVRNACLILRKRLDDYCAKRLEKDWRKKWPQMWPTIVSQAYSDRVDLSAEGHYKTPYLGNVEFPHQYGRAFHYFTYSASCSEVEIDVLTGETTVIRSDILYDAGKSLNPCIDIGQLEGAFVQGIGLMLTEDLRYGKEGRLLTNSTWTYKPPCSQTIPLDFRVKLHYSDRYDPVKGSPNEYSAVLGSKGIGEPGLVLAASVFFAVKHAIVAARQEEQDDSWFEMAAPATVAQVQNYCCTARRSLRVTG